jgi:pimeloyl-ACP methyl ester carboxylesterase
LTALDPDYARLPRPSRAAFIVATSRAEAVEVEIAELRAMGAANRELASAASLGDMPLVVLSHDRPWPDAAQEQAWQEAQAWAASLSTRGKLQVVTDSGHSIMIARPDAVIDAVRQVLAQAPRSA